MELPLSVKKITVYIVAYFAKGFQRKIKASPVMGGGIAKQ